MAEKTKLKVIGWVDYDDEYFPKCEELTDEVVDAIAEELRAHGYLFGGDSHQEHSACTPVLSDGTKACFSWRGWGHVIAVATDTHGDYSYMCGYMDRMIKDEFLKYPERGVDFSKLEVEKGKLHFIEFTPVNGDNMWFEYLMCVNDGEYAEINERDYLSFPDKDDGYYWTFYKVTRIYRAASFEEIIDELYGTYEYFDDCRRRDAERLERMKNRGDGDEDSFDRKLRQDEIRRLTYKLEHDCYDGCSAEAFGYPKDLKRVQLLEAMYKDFSREEVEKHGALCIRFDYTKDGDEPFGEMEMIESQFMENGDGEDDDNN